MVPIYVTFSSVLEEKYVINTKTIYLSQQQNSHGTHNIKNAIALTLKFKKLPIIVIPLHQHRPLKIGILPFHNLLTFLHPRIF